MLLRAILLNGFTQIHLCSLTNIYATHSGAATFFGCASPENAEPHDNNFMHRYLLQPGWTDWGSFEDRVFYVDDLPSCPSLCIEYWITTTPKIFINYHVIWHVIFIWIALVRKYFSMATRKSSRIAAKGRPVLRKFPGTPENGEASMQCSICLADIKFRGRLSVCKHKFCYACILEWSKVQLMKTFYDMTLMHFRTPTRAHSAREDIGVSRE